MLEPISLSSKVLHLKPSPSVEPSSPILRKSALIMLVLRLYNAYLLLASTSFNICNATQSWANPLSCTARGELM